mgnify:CR=1 FL=1
MALRFLSVVLFFGLLNACPAPEEQPDGSVDGMTDGSADVASAVDADLSEPKKTRLLVAG